MASVACTTSEARANFSKLFVRANADEEIVTTRNGNSTPALDLKRLTVQRKG